MVKTLRRLGFDIVSGCQLKCIGCPNSAINTGISFISLTDFATCLKNFDVAAISLLRLFNFGEPLLHPNLIELVLEIPKQTWWREYSRLEISTNGQYQDFSKITDLFKTGELDILVVSCDGNGTKEDYERLRPPAKWDVLMNFLSTGRRLRDEYAPNLKLRTRIIGRTKTGRERWNQILTPNDWEPSYRRYLYLPGVKQVKPAVTNKACHFIKDAFSGATFYVNSDGYAVPCCAHPTAHILGDLKRDKYNAILMSEVYKEFAQQLTIERTEHPICGDCIL
jgi:MoaA/NifB/PqqE/SkfB family radical SAM enzyme